MLNTEDARGFPDLGGRVPRSSARAAVKASAGPRAAGLALTVHDLAVRDPGVRDPAGHDPAADRWLVAKARAGNPEAYEALVYRHRGRVYRTALRILGNRADAEDVAQEVFIQVWVGGFAGNASFSTWLYRIAVNRSLSFERRRRRTEPVEDHEPVTRSGPEDVVITRHRADATARAIAALPPNLRVVFVLHQSERLSYREVGTILNLSDATVRGRLARARAMLLEQLQGWS